MSTNQCERLTVETSKERERRLQQEITADKHEPVWRVGSWRGERIEIRALQYKVNGTMVSAATALTVFFQAKMWKFHANMTTLDTSIYAPLFQKDFLESISLMNVCIVTTTSTFWSCTPLLATWTLALHVDHLGVLSALPRKLIVFITNFVPTHPPMQFSTSSNCIYVLSLSKRDRIQQYWKNTWSKKAPILSKPLPQHQLFITLLYFRYGYCHFDATFESWICTTTLKQSSSLVHKPPLALFQSLSLGMRLNA